MKYDLSQPISQRGIGEKDAENQRIAEIADELRRRSQIYEAESGAGQEHVSHFESELACWIAYILVPTAVVILCVWTAYLMDIKCHKLYSLLSGDR
jgi:hypothetical protein